MKNKKSQKGITIIALVLTVIILLILASVATYTGIESYNKAEQIKFVSQMKLIQAKVDEKVQDEEFNPSSIGENLVAEQIQVLNNSVQNDGVSNPTEDVNFNNYVRYFSKENLSTQLDLDNINEGIIINFKTREVISTIGFKYGGKTYYTQYKLPKGEKLTQYVKPNTILTFTYSKTAQDLSSIIKITKVERKEDSSSGDSVELKLDTLKYELWKKDINDNYSYLKQINPNEILISVAGDYKIKVIDNLGTECEQELTIKITNSPTIPTGWQKIVQVKEQENEVFQNYTNNIMPWYDYAYNTKFAYAINENDDYFVWIPRYAKNNTTNEIKFVKGNSNIFEDNTSMDDNWTVPEVFSPNNIKLTGFWLKVTEPNSQSIDKYLTDINENNIVYTYE